jgi:hypothetical protein
MAVSRMAASLASRCRQQMEPRPAAAANDALLAAVEGASTARAADREQEIAECGE